MTAPDLTAALALAEEVERLDDPRKVPASPWIVNRFDNDEGGVDYQIQSEGTAPDGGTDGSIVGWCDEVELKGRARHTATLIAAYRTAAPALAATLRTHAPVLRAVAEWVAAHRACDAAGEECRATERGGVAAGFDSLAATRERWSAAKRRLTIADAALFAAAAGMVSP